MYDFPFACTGYTPVSRQNEISKTICRICLRTDLKVQDIEETLVDFHDEITEYAIYENPALKYCRVCEYLLIKCYNFSRKCRQASKILKEFKIKKNKGFPSNLHEKLPQSLGCSIPATLQQFDLIDGTLIPLTVQLAVIKQENDTDDELDTNDNAQVVDSLQTNADEKDVLKDEANNADLLRDNAKNEKRTLTELADIDLGDEFTDLHSQNKLSKHKNTNKIQNQTTYVAEVKSEDYLNDINDDSSDEEVIQELIKLNKASKPKTKVKKKDLAKNRIKKPLKNRTEIEKVFEIELFATEQEAKEELEQRKTSEYYLSAQHKCEICYTVFRHAKTLDYHMRWHDVSAGSHECDICRMRFKRRAAVLNHSNDTHYGRFKCKKCHMITYHKMAMFKHYEMHAGTKFECKHCGRTYTHPSTYKTHLRLRHKTEHVCVTCARTFVSEKGLIAHRNVIHNTKSLVDSDGTARCEPCGLTFANEQVFTIHLKNTEKHKELANAIISCKLCGVRFDDIISMKEHRRSEHHQYKYKGVANNTETLTTNLATEKGTFNCTICGAEGSRLWVYRHVEAAHPESEYATDLKRRRQYMCDTCGKCYTSLYVLRDHINTHTGLKPYSCTVCPKRFTSRIMLKLHEDWHAPAKRECKRCGKKFVSASSLSVHMRSHIQDRRYKCWLCHKGFYHAGTLREHIRGVHNNVRRVRKLVKCEDDSSVVCDDYKVSRENKLLA